MRIEAGRIRGRYDGSGRFASAWRLLVEGLIGRTVSHYRILEQVGHGGMSSVFRAADLTGKRFVALKILSPHLAPDEQFHARFEREIQLLLHLQHPNIVPILDYGEVDGLAFIVMPYFSTGTLHQRLRQGPIDVRTGARIVDQLASALAFAHRNGVVHRDVKPSNVLLDERGDAFLSDFSFARPQDVSQNLTGSALIGTPAYMSPELVRGLPTDARSDQYSFAILLFQMATGQLPFEGETPMAVAMKHVSVPLPLPRSVNPNLPESVELVLIRALAKDPALRYDSIEDLNSAFQGALKSALDAPPKAGAVRSPDRDHTRVLYEKYQNVRPRARPRRYDRTVVLAILILLLACTVTAGAVALFSPERFWQANAAAPSNGATQAPTVDVPATIDAALTAYAPAKGTVLAPGELETAVAAAVLQTLQATLTPPGDVPPMSLPSETATGIQTATWTLSTSLPTATRTATPKTLSPTPTRTRTPSRTPSRTATSSGTTITLVPSATSTSPTDTVAAPTDTLPAPTATLMPTSDTPAPTVVPTVTKTPTTGAKVCSWREGNPSTSEGTVSVRVTNTGDQPVLVSHVSITWTGSDHLRYIHWRFEGPFWSGNSAGPTVSSATNKTVPVGASRTVVFEFWGSSFDGSASVSIDAGC